MLGGCYDLNLDFNLFLSVGKVDRQPQRIKIIIGLGTGIAIARKVRTQQSEEQTP